MSSCRLRALTPYGMSYIFTVDRIPVRVYEDRFILARDPQAPAMLLNTVCRVMDHMDVGEGDKVLIGNEKYTVSYVKGFQFNGEQGTVIPSHLVSECEVLNVGRGPGSKIQFKSPGASFRIQAFLGCFEDKVVIAHDVQPRNIDEIKLNAGFVYHKQKLFFGDIVDGYELQLWRGRPCICREGEYIELPSHILLKGE